MRTTKLKKVAKIITGFPFKGDQYTDEGIRTVRGENVTEGNLRWDKIKCWNQKFDKEIDYLLRADDIVIGMDGSKVGKNKARIKEVDLPLLLAQRVACVRAINDNDQVFLYYLINNPRFEEYVFRTQTGSSVPHISKSQIEDFEIPKLDYTDQQKIAKVLSDLDTKIELNNKVNAELEAMAKTLYDYWFVQFDFPDANGKPYKSSGGKMVYNAELKRDIPEGWEVYSLSSLVNCNKWTIKKDDIFSEINYLDTSSLTHNIIDKVQQINPGIDKVPSRAQRVISQNDILYSTVRPNQCHFGIIKEPVSNMIASTGFAQLRSKKDFISNDIIYTFLSSNTVTTRLQQIADTSVSAYPSISHNDILGLKVVLPQNNEILKKINNLLDNIYTKTSMNLKENQKLSSLRDWLLPMLMNGQVRVGEVEVLRQAHDDIFGMVAEPSVKYGKE